MLCCKAPAKALLSRIADREQGSPRKIVNTSGARTDHAVN